MTGIAHKQNNMRIRIQFLAAIIWSAAVTITSCKEHQPATTATVATIQKPVWLAGKWQNATKDGIVFENWMVINDSTMAGISGFIKGSDTIVSETIALQQRGTDLLYIPTVKDQNGGQPIPFKMTTATTDSIVFENPGHDFPDKIIYVRRSATFVMAKIAGRINGQPHTEEFPMNKVE